MNDSNKNLFWENPSEYFENSYTNAHSIPQLELEALRLAGLKERFEQLRDRVPCLNKLANAEGINTIEEIEDVVPLLFVHNTYKSYPQQYLEQNQFGKLNQWLDKLTTHDLSKLELGESDRIDGWINALAEQTPIMPWVSSGTSGKMTFFPHSFEEMDRFARGYPMTLLQDFGDDPEQASAEDIHEIWPFYRKPGGGMNHDFDLRIKYMLGDDESRFHAMFPSTNSLDIRYLQTQMRMSKLENWDQMDTSQELIEEGKRMEKEQAEMPSALGGFLSKSTDELRGKRVLMLGTWPMTYQMATLGLAAGKEGVFAPSSRILTGGGRKGTVLPDNWRDDVLRFTGVDNLGGLYGMTELLGRHTQCRHGQIHLDPWVISLLLDPETSKLLPRVGRQTGRYAFYDLLADSHWGGLITGDKMTIEWSEPCACGASSAYIVDAEIGRWADARGGTDDILPPGNASAHEAAMAYLNEFS